MVHRRRRGINLYIYFLILFFFQKKKKKNDEFISRAASISLLAVPTVHLDSSPSHHMQKSIFPMSDRASLSINNNNIIIIIIIDNNRFGCLDSLSNFRERAYALLQKNGEYNSEKIL
jgi:hypothetical protein